MKDGFLKVSAVTPKTELGDVFFNTDSIINEIEAAANSGAKIVVFPELILTGKTLGDLFFQPNLIKEAGKAISKIARKTENIVAVVGYPASVRGITYNAAAVIANGKILAVVPKENLSWEEMRYFAKPSDDTILTKIGGTEVPFGKNFIFQAENLQKFVFGVEIGDDPETAIRLSKSGAVMILNPSAVLAQDDINERLKAKSSLLKSAYIHASAGPDESTTDFVYSGKNVIFTNGEKVAESKLLSGEMVSGVIDLDVLKNERLKAQKVPTEDAKIISFKAQISKTYLPERLPSMPYIKEGTDLNDILNILAAGLKKRLVHTGTENVVLGVSGGLDSTLALIITCRAFDMAGLSRSGIYSITMPCFGTTDRTYQNAKKLTECLGATLLEIDIKNSVMSHFKDIGQDENNHDITYENSQARERTQVLMDKANQLNALVVGTGDMSELALGWATYNGDHMSMYAVNSGVPKTLVRMLVEFEAQNSDGEKKAVLSDILDTPVSPELIPGVQSTEDIVGPYELHDFFLYCFLKYNFPPSKIFRLAQNAFMGAYDRWEILKWLKVFMKRFFASQFKRSCMPDGPQVLDISLSPRSGLYMPSDASRSLWEREIAVLERAHNKDVKVIDDHINKQKPSV